MIWVVAASAQEPLDLSIDVERYRPTPDGSGYVVTESATTLEHLQMAFGLHLNQSDDPVVLRDETGARIIGPEPNRYDGMLDTRTRADLAVGIGFRNRLALGLTLPVVLWQQGFETSAPGPGTLFREPVPNGIGDVAFTLKGVFLARGPVGIAVVSSLSLPTGSTRSFLGEDEVTASPRLVVEVADRPVADDAHRVRAALNVGGLVKGVDSFRGVDFGSALTWSAGLAVRPVPFIEIGVDANQTIHGPRVAQQPAELLPHLRLVPLDVVRLTLGAGWGLRGGVGAPDRRLFASLTLSPRFDRLALDRDGDTIPNAYDRCPSVPEDLDGYGDADGCPEDDNDQDGLLDEVDQCPDLPEDLDGRFDLDGCPDLDDDADGVPEPMDRCPEVPEDRDGFQDLDGCPEADNDGDGILDPVDRCPMAAEVFNGFDDTDGCPDSKQYRDADADGATDDVDACPAEPEDFDRFEDDDGCPDPDNDGDGWLDAVDLCPNLPETRNGFEDTDGCPDEQPLVAVGAARLNIRDRVFFESDRAVIQAVSHPLLDEVARVILATPSIAQIRIEGHTDSKGGDYYNLRLSQARVRQVMAYLIARGVPAERLQAVGFGESRPIADNATEAGRAANRRVEFVIVRPGGG